MLTWMVAGWRTQYENLRVAEPPSDFMVDILPVVPYHEGGWIEKMPILQSSQKGTVRSSLEVLPLFTHSDYDAIMTQVLLPLMPFLVSRQALPVKRIPVIYANDWTPVQKDAWSEIYFGVKEATPAKRAVRDFLYRFALHRCAAVVACSQWAARSFHEAYGVPDDRIRVIPPGIDLRAWSVPSDRFDDGKRAKSDPFRLLFVGSDFERKGGPLLVDVFRQHLRGSCELHLVTKAEVEEELGLRVYRAFTANEPGLRELYARCDALVLPTRADCFSLASLEAMACGLPVITCPVGGIPEIVRHGETGVLVPPNDGPALLGAIESLVRDRHRAFAMGLAGRKVVEERFDNDQIMASMYSLLREISGPRERELPA